MTKQTTKFLLIFLMGVVTIAVLIGIWWFMERAAIANLRHALNHQELVKDSFSSTVTAACKGVKSGKTWVRSNDAQYVKDSRASSALVYRYVVLNDEVLDDPTCIGAITNSAVRLPYAISVTIAGKGGKEAANFYFKNGSES